MTTNTTIGSTGTVSQNLLNTMNGTTGTSSSSTASSSTSNNSTSAASLQSSFLQLLVTQLQNQDPTNPMDNSQMTSQLAQINTVSGISQLNTTLSSLASQLTAQQQAQSASLIGATVLTPGNSVTVSNSSGTDTITPFGVTLSGAATNVQIQVTNSSGQVVNTINLGKESAGTVPVSWTPVDASGNALPAGNYTIAASATIGGSPATPSTVTGAVVEGVLPQSSGNANLVLSNGNTVGLSTVAGIL
ncbi:flagellar hook assembly protein FlgD [Trinickia violacea]|uniref:Basal-body rod modification protein FlgD n=1 Tax=Trinickia violacea TaxID=2571746 RepID=A0A4P8IGK4_9BURK|nr:flagellar hook assembly protein FlgD [Trinickia violacea]QCP47792.1 flagellar hook assembly protein FlgD [Trinickia violacea]